MGLKRLSLHLQLSRSEPSSRMADEGTNTGNNNDRAADNAESRLSVNHDGSGAAAVPLNSPKRPSKFRLSSLKQLGAATRSEIRANVRNDWDWPLPEGEDGMPVTLLSRVGAETEYVEREPGSDESDDDDDDCFMYARPKGATTLLNGGFSQRRFSLNGHTRNGSDGQPASAEDDAAARKERRRKRLREELEWNEGLQTFEARRNAWTGTILKPPKGAESDAEAASGHHSEANVAATTTTSKTECTSSVNGPSQPGSGAQSITNGHLESAGVAAPAAPVAPAAGHPSTGTQEESRDHSSCTDPSSPTTTTGTATTGGSGGSTGSTSTAATSMTAPASDPHHRLSQRSSLTAVAQSEHVDLEPYVPLPPPLISDEHPVRREITPATYPQIYSRVVVQGTTPNLPINLSHMTAVLVAGWKADDQWPPKQTAPLDPLVGRRKSKSVGGAAGGAAANGGAANGAATAEGRSEKGIVSGIKKVLRITTGHHHPHHGTNGHDKAPTNGAALLDA